MSYSTSYFLLLQNKVAFRMIANRAYIFNFFAAFDLHFLDFHQCLQK